MRYIYRLLLGISTSTLLILSACGTGTTENSTAMNETPILSETQVEESKEIAEAEVSVPSESRVVTKEVKADSSLEPAEDAEVEEDAADSKRSEEVAPVETSIPENNNDQLSVLEQKTIEALAATTDLEIEKYSYLFTHEADYIEIEVRDATDDAQTYATLQGIYRYYPMTQEVFVRDYLSGEYFLY